MADLRGGHDSYWLDSCPRSRYAALNSDVEVDVAVIGGGIVGLTAAALLTHAGKRVAVLEARRIADQVTGRTTAKLTSLHGLIYDYLTRRFGKDHARLYAEANQTAIDMVANWVAEFGIECDFERVAAYTFTDDASKADEIHREVDATQALGLPTKLVTEAPIALPVTAAIRMDNQAQFHPRKFLTGLTANIVADGCYVFEHTRVIDVQGERPVHVTTDRGNVVARDVIVATNLPILDRGAHFARAFPLAHVALTARVEPHQLPAGMFIMLADQNYSFRQVRDPRGPLLLAVGPSFKPGHVSVAEKYAQLADFVRRHFAVQSFEHRWFGQDYYSADRLPYVGKLAPTSDHRYVATGFGGWGLTNGIAAATVLTGAITGTTHPWSGVYKPSHLKMRESASKGCQANSHAARRRAPDRLPVTPPSRQNFHDLPASAANVVRIVGPHVTAYRGDRGELPTVSAVCTHSPSFKQGNDVEHNWDCARHGSRFAAERSTQLGSTVQPLMTKNLHGCRETPD